MSSLIVTLVRHGNTDANNERWLQGHVGKIFYKTMNFGPKLTLLERHRPEQ
jgi:hypothetical protein